MRGIGRVSLKVNKNNEWGDTCLEVPTNQNIEECFIVRNVRICDNFLFESKRKVLESSMENKREWLRSVAVATKEWREDLDEHLDEQPLITHWFLPQLES